MHSGEFEFDGTHPLAMAQDMQETNTVLAAGNSRGDFVTSLNHSIIHDGLASAARDGEKFRDLVALVSV